MATEGLGINQIYDKPKEEKKKDPLEELLLIDPGKGMLVGKIQGLYEDAKDRRSSHEDRWSTAYHNYRGQYLKNVAFQEHEKSRLFIKVTKTKVLAAIGQIEDILFSSNEFPLEVRETPVPEGMPEYANIGPPLGGPESPTDVGYEGDGRTLKHGATFASLFETTGEATVGENVPLATGPSKNPQEPSVKPAKLAAERMNKLIKDQLIEAGAIKSLRKTVFEMALFGTGVMKGPFTVQKNYDKWTKEGEERIYSPIRRKIPHVDHVSIWRFYPDPNATCLEDAEYVVEEHVLNRIQLRDLGNRPFFNPMAISDAIKAGPNYTDQEIDSRIKTEDTQTSVNQSKYSVLEFWGIITGDEARQAGLPIDEDLFEVQVNAWVCGPYLLRLVLNPFQPFRIPYQAVPYEVNPYSIFGVGVAENMDDSQSGMNGSARMAVDNLALAGNLVFDIDESALAPGQDTTIYPGKKFVRNSGMPGQAIFGLKFPNTAPDNMQMFDRFRQLADESTGLPSYSHGYTGVTGMTRTAAGMSMLMGAASQNIKTVIRNIDEFLLKPLGNAMFQWNMQFYEGDLNIEGDLEVLALGSSSVMQKEVRSQRLLMFMQNASNQIVAPRVRWSAVLKEFAKTLDLDPREVIADDEEALLYAKIIGTMNMSQGEVGPPPQASMNVGDTGNGQGNIGVGSPPMPGMENFASNDVSRQGIPTGEA